VAQYFRLGAKSSSEVNPWGTSEEVLDVYIAGQPLVNEQIVAFHYFEIVFRYFLLRDFCQISIGVYERGVVV
jgi:hypothetical protein